MLWYCIRENGGSLESTVLVVQKLLTKFDVSKTENRLLMTMHQEFLMAAEKKKIINKEEDMKVTVFAPKLQK